jgi:putative transposase
VHDEVGQTNRGTREALNPGSTWIIGGGTESVPEGVYRIVLNNAVEKVVYLTQLRERPSGKLKDSRKRPSFGLRSIDRQQFETGIAKGLIRSVELLSLQKLPSPDSELKEVVSGRLAPLSSLAAPAELPLLLDPITRPRRFQAIARSHGIDVRDLRKLFDRLLTHGMDVEQAAVERRGRSRRAPTEPGRTKRGRPNKLVSTNHAPEWKGINVDAAIKRQIHAFVESGGYKPDRPMTKNLADFNARFATGGVQLLESGRVMRRGLPEDQSISRHQFRYHLEKLAAQSVRDIHDRKVKALFSGVNKIRIGHSRAGITAPGQQLIIDSTVADVYLVCAWDRTRIIGRPNVYVVIDALTSVVVGIHITLRPPSAEQALVAFYKALTDKAPHLRKLGLGQFVDLFPTAPNPTELVHDRGELHSFAGRRATGLLGIIQGVPPAYVPIWRALVERHFRTLNDDIIHWMPGSTRGRIKQRGHRDYRLDACLTLSEFENIIYRSVMLWNLRGRPSAKLHPSALHDDGASTVVGGWHWGLKHRHGSARYLDLTHCVTRLLQPIECTVGARGIIAANKRWVAEDMARSGTWALLAGKPLNLYPDPWSPNEAFVEVTGQSGLRNVSLASEWPTKDTWCQEDLEEYRVCSELKQDLQTVVTKDLQATVTRSTDAIIDAARRETEKAVDLSTMSDTKRIASIRTNRAAEVAGAPAAGDDLDAAAATVQNETHRPVKAKIERGSAMDSFMRVILGPDHG